MAFRFDLQEPFLKAIPRLAGERIDRVIESLSEKPHPGAVSIHDARKDLKSLRALLRLVRGSIDEGARLRENVLFREAGRSLSSVRDPQALLEVLENLTGRLQTDSGRPTSKRESMRVFTSKIHREIEQTLVDGLPSGLVRKLVRELREAKRRAALWFEGNVFRPGNEWEIFVGTGLRRTYRKAKNLVWQFEVIGREKADDQAWHELRKSAKALGYQLRLLKSIWPGVITPLVDEIDQLTDRLGDANDLAILGGKILNQPYNPAEMRESGEPRRIFLQSLDRRKQKLHAEAFEIARLIYAEKPGQFERRCAAYWLIRSSRSDGKRTKRSSNVDLQPGTQTDTDRDPSNSSSSSLPILR
jgi:CHAD domain-containing protein